MVHLRKKRVIESEILAAQAGTLGDPDEVTQRLFLEVLLDIRHLVHRIYEKGFLHRGQLSKEEHEIEDVNQEEEH